MFSIQHILARLSLQVSHSERACDAPTAAASHSKMTLRNNSGRGAAAVDNVDVTFGTQLRLLLLKNFYLRKRQLVGFYT